MLQKIKNFLQMINLNNLEKFFFALFLLSIPIQTRITFITPQTHQNGSFNEYATFFLYLSDLLLITTLFIYFVNVVRTPEQLTKINNFSIKTYFLRLFHSYPRLIPIFTLLITLITWSFISILWSEYKNQAFYQSFKLLEFALLFLYFPFRLQWFGFNKFASLFFIAGFFESIIGIIQYCLQKSLGLKLLMESVLSPEISNVAKVVVDGEKIIRAYGTFPHPNIFSGFLILSIFCGFWLLKTKLFHLPSLKLRQDKRLPPKLLQFIHRIRQMAQSKLFHVKQFIKDKSWLKQNEQIVLSTYAETTMNTHSPLQANTINTLTDAKHNKQIVSRLPAEASYDNTINNIKCKKEIVSRETIYTKAEEGETILYFLLAIGIIIQLIALLLTFSRTAWAASITIITTFIVLTLNYKLFHVKQFIKNKTWLKYNEHIVSRETISEQAQEDKAINSQAKIHKIILLTITISLLSIIYINYKQIINITKGLQDTYQQSIKVRNLYNNIAFNIINEHPVTGIGNKNFTLKMQDFSNKPLEWWQFQPAHNIYLLIASEIGLIGLTLFLMFIYFIIKTSLLNITKLFHACPSELSLLSQQLTKITQKIMFHVKHYLPKRSGVKQVSNETLNNLKLENDGTLIKLCASIKDNAPETTTNTNNSKLIVSRETILINTGLLSILIGFMFIGLLDHYFWTLQQGQLTFWVLLGTIVSFKK